MADLGREESQVNQLEKRGDVWLGAGEDGEGNLHSALESITVGALDGFVSSVGVG